MKSKNLKDLKTEFLSSISHELCSPLSIIEESLKQLETGILGELNPRQKKIISIAKRNTLRLADFIFKVLDMQRLEAGKMEFYKDAIDIRGLILSIYHHYKPACSNKTLELRLSLPQTCSPLYVDPERFNQIIKEILSNAIKFTDRGFIEVKVEERGVSTKIKIKDTGIGMDRSEIPLIFEIFRQTKVSKGTGLGLAIARRLIEMHNAKIEVKSSPQKGTEFILIFPNLLNKDVYREYLNSLSQKAKSQRGELVVLNLRVFPDHDSVGRDNFFKDKILYFNLLRLKENIQGIFIIKDIELPQFIDILKEKFHILT